MPSEQDRQHVSLRRRPMFDKSIAVFCATHGCVSAEAHG